MKSEIRISRNIHGTIDVVIYHMPNTDIRKWFELTDIWGSWGYDRFNDGGLYFELPENMYSIIPTLPFINRYGITINQI